jgi:hypothetical protein
LPRRSSSESRINHPHLDATTITTTNVEVRDSLKVLMAVLGLVGISGMYLSQVLPDAFYRLLAFPTASP